MKKTINIKTVFLLISVFFISLVFIACDDDPVEIVLDTPANLSVTDEGLITWDKVTNATKYVVTINNEAIELTECSYQIEDTTEDYTFFVIAMGAGFTDSLPTEALEFEGVTPIIEPKPPKPVESTITVGIKGATEVKSGKSISLSAVVNGTDNTKVIWKITTATENAVIDENGHLTASVVKSDEIIEVTAQSVADEKVVASKIITIVAKPKLTQEMLDALDMNKISFEGYVNINLYKMGLYEKLSSSYTTVVKTAMDGTNWFAEYINGDTNTKVGLYYKNHNEKACQVGVSFMNDEDYFPMKNDQDEEVSWNDSGLYNNFKDLLISDFTFNEETWRYEYIGSDETLATKVVASSNPYDFVPTGFALIIEEGEVMGIYSKSEPDYTIVEGYKAIQELTVAINYGETVDVPTISKYSHEDIHDDLGKAIENMRKLTSYNLDFKEITASYLTTGYVESGFNEIVTPNDCYFKPYDVSYDVYGKEVHTYLDNAAYGFKVINDNLYNAYMENEDGTYSANRAYEKDFSNAKPTFAFAPEIFRTYAKDEEEGTVTYYVDKLMSPVASTFYFGMGNDINLYGIFATEGYTSTTDSFTPYVVVKDGYITEAVFYFYLGSIFGVVEIKYSEFNEAKMPEETKIEFETRYVPTSWEELTINVSKDSSSTSDDESVNALEFLKSMYKNDNIGAIMPFFGNVLGDTYGFGLTTIRIPGGSDTAISSVVFYYDVPLDVDYTINASLTAIGEYLIGLGFTKNQYNEYTKGSIHVAPVDSSLDLVIYVW